MQLAKVRRHAHTHIHMRAHTHRHRQRQSSARPVRPTYLLGLGGDLDKGALGLEGALHHGNLLGELAAERLALAHKAGKAAVEQLASGWRMSASEPWKRVRECERRPFH